MSFDLTLRQQEAAQLITDPLLKEILLYGGGRSGKTLEFVYSIICRAMKVPSRHAILRQAFAHCKQSIWLDTLPKCIKIGFPGLVQYYKTHMDCWNKSDFFLKVPTPIKDEFSEIWIGGLDDDERTEKILGKEYSTIFFNEISQISYKSFSIAKTRLAEKNALNNKLYCDCNPPKRGHWSFPYFMELLDPETSQPRDNPRVGKLLMNPKDNLENIDAEYLTMLDSLPKLLRDRFKDGIWCSDETDIFRAEWITPSEKIPALKDVHTVFTFIDPAVTEKARETDNSCESSIITVAIDYDMVIHEIETIHGFFSYKQLKDIAYNCYKQYSNVSNYLMGVEDVQAQRWLGEDLNEMGVPIEYVRPDADKVRRAISVTDLFERGQVRINDPYLRRQLLGFPGEKLKDCVDAIVHALRLCRNYIKEKVDRQINPLKDSGLDANSQSFWEDELKERYEPAPNHADFGRL